MELGAQNMACQTYYYGDPEFESAGAIQRRYDDDSRLQSIAVCDSSNEIGDFTVSLGVIYR